MTLHITTSPSLHIGMLTRKLINPKWTKEERQVILRQLNELQLKHSKELDDKVTVELPLHISHKPQYHILDNVVLSQVLARFNNGAIIGEYSHPRKYPLEDDDNYKCRVMRIDLNNTCCQFRNPHLLPDHSQLFVQVKPWGPLGPIMQKLLVDRLDRINFGLRLMTDADKTIAFVTWDFIDSERN